MQDLWCRREVLAPLQQAEAIDIRRKSDAFGEKVEDFRKFFQQKAPFSVPGGELKLEHVSRTEPSHIGSKNLLWSLMCATPTAVCILTYTQIGLK